MLPDSVCNLISMVFHILPVSNNKVLFSSFHGQYNDNPKYISEEMHKRYPNIKQYWVFSNKSKMNDIPSYVHRLKYNTLQYCIIKNRCSLIVENGAGEYLFDNSSHFFTFKKKLKNKKQIDFSTWHGNPIKHIGAQIPGNEFWNNNTFFTSSDIMIAGCERVKNIFSEAFLGKIPVELLGTPRTDILFNNNPEKNESLKRKLGLPQDKKIVLYAPTYRDNPDCSGVEQLKLLDFKKLFLALKNRFGGEWVFVFRVHNMVLLKIDVESITKDYQGDIINGNMFDDMAEYLAVADVLLSDYSGCIYDVALTNKPCFLFAFDKENYEKEERGLYFPLDKFPYSFDETIEQLYKSIENYDEKEIEEKKREFLHFIGNIEDGNASARVVDYLSKYIECKNNKY